MNLSNTQHNIFIQPIHHLCHCVCQSVLMRMRSLNGKEVNVFPSLGYERAQNLPTTLQIIDHYHLHHIVVGSGVFVLFSFDNPEWEKGCVLQWLTRVL